MGQGVTRGTARSANVEGYEVAGKTGASDQLSVGDKAATWFSLVGSVTLFVALLNLVPLLPLDGGHIAGAIYEWIKRNLAKLFGKADPGPVDTARALPLTYFVGGFLLVGGIVLVLADIISPIQLFCPVHRPY